MSERQTPARRVPQSQYPSDAHPHPEANEIVSDRDLQPEASPSQPGESVASPTERRLGRNLLVFVAIAIGVGLLAVIIFVQPMTMKLIAVGVFVAIALLFMAPVILARETKVAEDEDVRSRRRSRGGPGG